MRQEAPYPQDLWDAVTELRYGEPPWLVTLADEARGQECSGLTLSIYPDKPDSYHPDQHVRTRFVYPVPAAAFNRESWEEWLWARFAETEDHERAENFKFRTLARPDIGDVCTCGHKATYHDGRSSVCQLCDGVDHRFEFAVPRFDDRRPFKPAHTDGWDPGVVRTVVSESVANTPNAGRLVKVPCSRCPHHHSGRMGEHFTIEAVHGCAVDDCPCTWSLVSP